MPPLSQADQTTPAKSWAIVPLALAVLLASLGMSSANVALPTLAQAFGVPFGMVQWVVLAYLLAMTALLVAAGRFGDLAGRRRLFLAGLALSAVASVACAAAPGLAILVAARAIQGAGAAAMMAMSFALVGEAVPKQRQGAAMGALAAMSALGTMLGPALGGLVLAGLGWRLLFLLNMPLALCAWLIGWRHLPLAASSPGPRRATFDWPGMVLLAASLGAYAMALTPGQAGALGDGTSLGLLVAAVVGMALFLIRQARAASPLLALDLFRDGVLDVGLATSVLVSTVMMATLVAGPFYLSHALGLPLDRVGLVLAIGPCVSVLAGVPAGRLADRLGAQRVATTGLALLTAGAWRLSLATPGQGALGYVLPIILLCMGYALFQAPNTAAVMARADANRRGAVSSLLNLFRNLGLLTGASLMGTLFASEGETTGSPATSPEAVAAGMHICFSVATALAGGAFLLALSVVAMQHFLPRTLVMNLSSTASTDRTP